MWTPARITELNGQMLGEKQRYEAREVLPPEGYLATGVLSRFFEIREQGKTVMCNTAENSIRNDPIRGDLEGVKIADGTARRLAGVPFKITSKTTGESHVVVTDRNGQFSTASEWAPHSRNTNAGQTAGDGVWFGDPDTLDDEKGALPYDTYILEEQPCEANSDMELLILEVTVYRPNTIIHLGTLTDDRIPQPEISRSAYLRRLILKTPVKACQAVEIRALYAEINKIGSNINQIARSVNAGIASPQTAEQSLFLLKKVYDLMFRLANQ